MGGDNKTTKHIGEQLPLTQTPVQGNKPSQTGNGGGGNSNTQGNNPLKPRETQKGIKPEKTEKK
ncbi:MAG: hypothetical protein K6T77_06285 [candidate division WOR-3 bacterium]|jgi:hypothetical protein|nr:hypothetical protein [candidate division WOR-3 bacterium]MCR4423047.1 hypothetical protein [candidate division WOR-3 bacterium]MDH7518386.1 hypothetical protein [bacterium]